MKIELFEISSFSLPSVIIFQNLIEQSHTFYFFALLATLVRKGFNIDIVRKER